MDLKVSVVLFAVNLEEYNKILKGAGQLFFRIGIKSASMDDIARELGISKKTIYKHFEDKRSLVHSVLTANMKSEQEACIDCYKNEGNAVQTMIDVAKFISKAHKDMNPALLFDLRKYYPELWSKMDAFRREFIHNAIQSNIEEGQKEGLFRKSIIPEVVATLYINTVAGVIDSLSNPRNQYDFSIIHKQMISYHLYGICSPKGQHYLEQHINEI